MNKIFTLIIGIILTAHAAEAQDAGSWGDQGDGTYKNPILESNYPDNDVIRAGDTFYMMSSTCHFVPGMTILKSKDLVNWEFSNHIMPAPITFDGNFAVGNDFMVSHGTWAGSFGYDGENYFAYWCYNTKRNKSEGKCLILYSKAKGMEGPWSVPKEITWPDGSSIETTDPGVMWDLETKQAWFSIKSVIYPMAWAGDKLLKNEGQGIIVTKTMRGESNKLYKFDGVYYQMNTLSRPEAGAREQVISRAKSIEGPWESRVVLENGNGTDRCPGQGSLLKLDDGSWWFIHQLAKGAPDERYQGRPQFLEPVVWKDGWPLIGVDTNGNGIGEVVWAGKKPIQGFPVTAPATDDDFDKPDLGQQWYWRFNPRMDRWSLTERPGFLRLKSCVRLSQATPGSLDDLPNLIAQRMMGRHRNVMTARLDLTGMADGQEGGMHISAGDNNIIGVKKDAGDMHLFFKSAPTKGAINTSKGIALKQSDIWLQTKVENGLATFHYSLDGKTFTQMGGEVQLRFTGFTANAVGFYTMNTKEEEGWIDVDWFKYDYDGPKGK